MLANKHLLGSSTSAVHDNSCWCAGGRFHIHATSDGLKKDAETFPDLLVTLKLQGLHAPLAERFVELPVDITAGVPLCPNLNSYAVITPAEQSCSCKLAAGHNSICPSALTPLPWSPPPTIYPQQMLHGTLAACCKC